MNPIVIWFAIGVACMAGELFTASFVVVFFGAGAWAAALVAAVHPGPEQELAAFLLVSLASLLFCAAVWSRCFAETRRMPPQRHPGAEARRNSSIRERLRK